MKTLNRFLITILLLVAVQLLLPAQNVSFVDKSTENKIEVLIDGKLITAYTWPSNVYKPVLYPIFTASGTEITRGFPLKPRAGERNDHIHQVGMWLNYGNVNGFDFWGNGHTGQKSENGGVIQHTEITNLKGGKGSGTLAVKAVWLDPSGKALMQETTEFHFIPAKDGYMIDRITSLTATGGDISMPDTKEGMFAIRMARQLELPSADKALLLDETLKPGTEKASENRDVTGNYLSSEGVTGDAVWSTRARWMQLAGVIGNEKISVVICDHPSNPGYPTYWHARGYGLFSANPFGVKDFTGGKQVMNFSIPSGQTITLRYRVIVGSGNIPQPETINNLADDFADKYR